MIGYEFSDAQSTAWAILGNMVVGSVVILHLTSPCTVHRNGLRKEKPQKPHSTGLGFSTCIERVTLKERNASNGQRNICIRMKANATDLRLGDGIL
ncbi:hypothetical protein EYC84_010301 [Monilinia fructicola]|uniref:Uncharacterized protein n=1 Tax=Monilinia fructicola TaxID=38448 RepID=A0A5M9JHQ6_MONFR|nr:hypothetical protein EYC84_010301 [Monilinia fructicola]